MGPRPLGLLSLAASPEDDTEFDPAGGVLGIEAESLTEARGYGRLLLRQGAPVERRIQRR